MLRAIHRWILYPIIVAVLALAAGGITIAVTTPSDERNPDFEISSFAATYVLVPAQHGALDVLVTETISTRFSGVGNHGIIRELPLQYQNHFNDIRDVEVEGRLRTDRESEPTDWRPAGVQEDRETDRLVLRIGSALETLEPGEQHFRISYRLTDIALNTPDGSAQEVYLDVNGTGWDVPAERVSARLEVPTELAGSLNGNARCYQGPAGSTRQCTITQAGTSPAVFEAAATGLGPYESMTFAVGFEPGTFGRAYTPHGLFDGVRIFWFAAPVVLVGLVAAGALLPPWWRRRRLLREVIVTRYQAPDGVEPLVAADVWGRPERGPAAQLLQAAVQRQIELTVDEQPGSEAAASGSVRLTGSAVKALRRDLRIEGLRELTDRGTGSFLRGYFSQGLAYAPSGSILERRESIVADAGVRQELRKPAGWFLPIYFLLLFVATFGAVGVSLAAGWLLWWFTGLCVAAVLALILVTTRVSPSGPLTTKGEIVYQELRGLHDFMGMAERDRIAYLQNVASAPRTEGDGGALIKLYEPLLPYAVIFGMEDTWASVLGEAHDDRLPTVPQLAAVLAAVPLSSLSDSLTRDGYHPTRAQTLFAVNDRVDAGFSHFGERLTRTNGLNDFGDGFRGGGGGWSSGGSGGGGSSGGGMGGGGGSSW